MQAETENEPFYVSIMERLFQYAENGSLDNLEPNKYIFHFVKYSTTPNDKEYKLRLKKFRQSITNFLKKLEITLDEAERVSDGIAKTLREQDKKFASLPEFGSIDDNDITIKFILSLERDLYNYSQAETALGNITRQTLSKKIREGYLGIKLVIKGKTEYISKQDLIRIYRELNPCDNWNF